MPFIRNECTRISSFKQIDEQTNKRADRQLSSNNLRPTDLTFRLTEFDGGKHPSQYRIFFRFLYSFLYGAAGAPVIDLFIIYHEFTLIYIIKHLMRYYWTMCL